LQVTNEYNDLEKEEVNIISGTLELKEKMVKDVMTKVDDAFMLPEDAMLDFETLNEIREKGKKIVNLSSQNYFDGIIKQV
jgi:metal transporter CNNM